MVHDNAPSVDVHLRQAGFVKWHSGKDLRRRIGVRLKEGCSHNSKPASRLASNTGSFISDAFFGLIIRIASSVKNLQKMDDL